MEVSRSIAGRAITSGTCRPTKARPGGGRVGAGDRTGPDREDAPEWGDRVFVRAEQDPDNEEAVRILVTNTYPKQMIHFAPTRNGMVFLDRVERMRPSAGETASRV